MKQVSKQIIDFILAFNLANPVKGVCFDAMVFLYTDTLVLQVESEIHIISIKAKKTDVLYILNSEIISKGFPDMFESKHWEIDFKGNKGLLLTGVSSKNINYAILIQPAGKDCVPATMEEIEENIKHKS
ncbi:MAG: hypothetical protein ABI402_13535 [Ferruginibacter sp.]